MGAVAGHMRDVVIGFVVAVIIFGILVWISFSYKDGAEASLLILCGAFGSAVGWVIGIIATPYNTAESQRLTEIGKVAYGFLTGYVLSKVDPLLSSLGAKADLVTGERLWVYAIFTITALLVSFAVTFLNRTYWLNSDEQRSGDLTEPRHG